MKISFVRIGLAAALALVVAGSGFYFYRVREDAKELERLTLAQAQLQAAIARHDAERRAKLQAEMARPMADKAWAGPWPKSYPQPISEWQSTEKTIYQKLLSSGQFDVLVVPFQVQEYALDRPTRSLMTAELAMVIAGSQNLRVPDPYLVARALGDGDRRLDRNEVCSFATKLGVKKIIWIYVGHDRKKNMSLSIQLQDSTAGSFDPQAIQAPKNFLHIAFTDETPPIELYQSMLPEILKAIGMEGATLPVIKTAGGAANVKLPPTPLALVAEKPDPARDALYFQLLASLTPHAAERTREHFAEKSLLAVFSMSPDSPDYRLLKARGFMLLGLRPAALQVLGEPHTPEEQELFATLNGNQPDVEQFSSKIKPGVLKVIARQDANTLVQHYTGADKNKSSARAAALNLPGKTWPLLAYRGYADLDLWAQFDNIAVKRLLDQDFPIKDYTADGIIRGAASLGNEERLQMLLDLSVITHTRKLLDTDASKWCCHAITAHPSQTDYLSLLEAIGDDDLMRRADFLTNIQGMPERTLAFLSQVESVYKGNARFSLARGQAQLKRSKAVEEPEKSGLLEQATVNMFNAAYWEQGQSLVSAMAFENGGTTGPKGFGGRVDNYFASDYPYRSYYPNWEHGGNAEYMIPNAEAALKNSTFDLSPLSYLEWFFKQVKDNGQLDTLYKSLEGRFAGNPAIYKLWAEINLEKGNVELAEHNFRSSIQAQPKVWQTYFDLGNILIEQGRLKEADKLFSDYPGFKAGAEENAVGISNYAYAAGSKFYWLGEFALATPLYMLASKHPTGSDADIASRTRLKLLSSDYQGALLDTLERARHYNSSYAYRDYLGMLHAMGFSKDAWDGFNLLVNQMDVPHLWETALVGHRKESKSESDVAEWTKQLVQQGVGRKNNWAANYLLRAAMVDRTPSKDFAASLAAVTLPVWKHNYQNPWVVQQSPDGLEIVVGPNLSKPAPIEPTKPAPTFSQSSSAPAGIVAQKVAVKSHLVYFAEAYRAIRTGDYNGARTLLTEASSFYDLSIAGDGELSYVLPYYAFASAKSGDVSAIEKYIGEFTPSQQGFDYLLAHAVLSGIAGKADESVKFLKSALYKRPFTEERPLPSEYQYAEICVWLYEATGDVKYREMALDWARKNQKFNPWFAWAYAMEAVLSNNKADRSGAIAMASYLDPQSEMLGKIPQQERNEAIKAAKWTNPFLKQNMNAAQSAI